MKKKIGIVTLDRMGSNHLLACLHYQNKIYSFQEGNVDFPSATPESVDVFGFGKDNEARNLKFDSSEYFVWKLDRRHIQYDMTKDLPPFKSYLEYFAPNDLLIFNMRHPFLVLKSGQRYASQQGRPVDQSNDWELMDGDENPLLYDYEVLFREIHKANERGSIRIHTTFHERIVEDYNETMSEILGQLDLEYDKIYDYQDYFQTVRQITGQSNISTGSGGYRPARVVKFDDVLESIKDHERLIDKVYERCAKKYPSEQLLQFKNFYTNLHNRI